MSAFYEFQLTDIDGKTVKLDSFADQAVLIVNLASQCGLTAQYQALQKLYSDYRQKGFVVLGFPCNQFGGQEPGTSDEIKVFASDKYGVTFPLFAKIEVNGTDSAPLYQWLKANSPGDDGKADIKWNFAKFLIDKKGNVSKRIDPQTEPEQIRADIEALLA